MLDSEDAMLMKQIKTDDQLLLEATKTCLNYLLGAYKLASKRLCAFLAVQHHKF
jgi:hypothetical protein